MPRAPDPVTSFGAELNAVLRRGANREVRIKLPDKNLAVRFKQRLNKLRRAMKAAKHPDWEQLYRCSVTSDLHDPTVVVLAPKDSEFRQFIAGAGIDIDATPPLSTEVSIGPIEPGTVDSFLAELSDATSVQKILSEDTEEEPDVTKL